MSKPVQYHTLDFNSDLKLKGFKVYEIDNTVHRGHSYCRKDFYKISSITGKYNFHYPDKSFETNKAILFFGNPRIPYSVDVISPSHKGYSCLFTEDFLKLGERSASLHQSPLFKINGTPVLKLNSKQEDYISSIFQKMIAEQDSDYAYKDELIRNCINLIIHEALKLHPLENNSTQQKNASVRIASLFLDLLEKQFPIENVQRPLEVKTAQDFAKQLSVHINYLNRSVKEVTGKTTTTHIAERITGEAKALLQHTDWNVADIAFALGFEYPTYFNNFFKKRTGHIPKFERAAQF